MKKQEFQDCFNPMVDMALDERNHILFNKLVPVSPVSGCADTIPGELLRAINRLVYRYCNYGDIYNEGYGIETCMSSYLYLRDTLVDHGLVKGDINLDMDAARCNGRYDKTDTYYTALHWLMDVVINYCEVCINEGNLPINGTDSRNYDTDIVDEMVAQYERNSRDDV
jgi:hypothetical protein